MATKRSQEATHEQHQSAAHGRKVIWHFTSVAGWVRGGADHELDCVTGAWCETLHSQPASNARTHPYPGLLAPEVPHRQRILAKASSAVSSASGKVCRYFSVVAMLAWPSRSFTTCRSAPPASSHDAWAWRRSCIRT